MRTIEEVTALRDRLTLLAMPDSPIPDSVRRESQDICHTLTWVLDERDSKGRGAFNPYYVLAGCCCDQAQAGFSEAIAAGRCDEEHLILACSLISGCLCPGHEVEESEAERVAPLVAAEVKLHYDIQRVAKELIES